MRGQSKAFEGIRIAVRILMFLSATRSVSTTDVRLHLAAHGHERTSRSIQRLMDDLCEGFDIARDDSSRPFGYRWKPNARGLGLPALGDQEALVLLLARQHLDHLLPASVLKAVDPLFHEARQRLDPFHGVGDASLRFWPNKIAVVSQIHPLIPPPLIPGVLDQVSEALQADHWLDVDYCNSAGKRRKNARVMPLALVQQGARLFLVCRFEGFENQRHLALHRICSASVTNQPFVRPTFDLPRYVREGGFGFGHGEQIVLKLDVDAFVAGLLLETRISADQTVRAASDGRYEVTATTVRSEQLRWWLRTYGSAELRVVSPVGFLTEPTVRQNVDSGMPAPPGDRTA